MSHRPATCAGLCHPFGTGILDIDNRLFRHRFSGVISKVQRTDILQPRSQACSIGAKNVNAFHFSPLPAIFLIFLHFPPPRQFFPDFPPRYYTEIGAVYRMLHHCFLRLALSRCFLTGCANSAKVFYHFICSTFSTMPLKMLFKRVFSHFASRNQLLKIRRNKRFDL